MAEYKDLDDLVSDTELQKKIRMAVRVKAAEIIDLGAPTTPQITWAADAIENPSLKAVQITAYVLAVNKENTVSQILAAGDSVVQGHVDTAIDKLIAGGVA